MSNDVIKRDVVSVHQLCTDTRELIVLFITITAMVSAFQFYADGKVIAARPALKTRLSRMPGPAIKRDELNNRAIAANQHVAGDLDAFQIRQIRVAPAIKMTAKERFYIVAPKMARRQTDPVDDQKADLRRRTFIRKTGDLPCAG